MQALTLEGEPPIEIILRRSARARRITLRVSSLDGRVTLTLPKSAPLRVAKAFAEEREGWLRKHLAARMPDVDVAPGALLPVAGVLRRIETDEGRRVRLEDDRLLVPAPMEKSAARIEAYLKLKARNTLAAASDHYAALLGRTYSSITLRDARSRWGSCSSAGRLMYSWRLILAPPDILNYVAAHEVAHLEEMNHSAAFWRIVSDLYGDHAPPRRWLRSEGGQLHRYRFGD